MVASGSILKLLKANMSYSTKLFIPNKGEWGVGFRRERQASTLRLSRTALSRTALSVRLSAHAEVRNAEREWGVGERQKTS
jgi:hypothetical protein